jgi:hypothetical protein
LRIRRDIAHECPTIYLLLVIQTLEESEVFS